MVVKSRSNIETHFSDDKSKNGTIHDNKEVPISDRIPLGILAHTMFWYNGLPEAIRFTLDALSMEELIDIYTKFHHGYWEELIQLGYDPHRWANPTEIPNLSGPSNGEEDLVRESNPSNEFLDGLRLSGDVTIHPNVTNSVIPLPENRCRRVEYISDYEAFDYAENERNECLTEGNNND